MDYHTSKIKLHVDLLNFACSTVCAVQPTIAAVFAKLVGTKVIKVDGTFTKAVKTLVDAAIEPFELNRIVHESGQNSMIWVSNDGGAVSLHVKVSMTCGEFTEYLESDWCKIGDIDGSGTFVELFAFDPTDYKHDWDLTDVLSKIEEVKRHRKAATEAENMIPDFMGYCR